MIGKRGRKGTEKRAYSWGKMNKNRGMRRRKETREHLGDRLRLISSMMIEALHPSHSLGILAQEATSKQQASPSNPAVRLY